MNSNLSIEYHKVNPEKAQDLEMEINGLRDLLRDELIDKIKDNKIDYIEGSIYNDSFAECEKLGDHVINVTESIIETK